MKLMGDCDCCGEHRELRRVVYLGMDTDVCAECVGDNEFEVSEPEREPEYEHEDWLEDLK